MARTAVETANLLSMMYNESFGGEDMEMFRIGWPELRGLAGIPKLTDEYLADINRTFMETDYTLVSFNDFLVVAMQDDFNCARKVPPRLLEQNLPDEDELVIDEDGNVSEDEEIE